MSVLRLSTSLFVILLGLAVSSPAQAKSGSTIFTPERVTAARENIKNFDWARAYRDQVVSRANFWAGFSDEQLWNLPVEQTVPRSMYVNRTVGCPIHGDEVLKKHGVYGWRVDPKNHPWKVQCPIGGETWPTNDFGAYYQSGKDGNHIFQASRANRNLLYSTDSSRNYGVDDGTGYVDGHGREYKFIAYYVHWAIWQNIGRSWGQALSNLGEAYVLTGEPRYAHKAAILLSRVADLLPSMDTNYWSVRGYVQGDGFSHRGLMLGSIWDAPMASAIARSYDAIYPSLANNPALYTFLQGKASKYGLTRVDTPQRLSAHIEKNTLAVLMRAIQDHRIRANEGSHQTAYAEAAISLDDPIATPQWLSWLMEEGTMREGGGHLPTIFIDWIDRDGGPNEGSLGYNSGWLSRLQQLADVLEDSPYAEEFSLRRYPNFRNFLSLPFWTQLTDDYYPHIGNDNSTGNPDQAPLNDANRYAAAFQRYGFPELAQMAYSLNGDKATGLHGNIYDPGAAETAQAIQEVIAEHGQIERDSIALSGLGLTTLYGEADGRESSVWLHSGRMNKHGHRDRLNLGLFAYDMNLMPDLGYPDFPMTDSPGFWGWYHSTVAHNTVVVDAGKQEAVRSGVTRVLSADHPVKVMEVDGNGVYPQTEMYRRSVLRIPIGDGFYLVDLFRVKGGKDHLYSLHSGPGGVIIHEGLTLEKQEGGTYAGPGVSFGTFYDGTCCSKYMGSGFQFLDDVYHDKSPQGDFVIEWDVEDNWNAAPAGQRTRLKLWSVSDHPSSVSFALGYPADNRPGNPESLRWLLERRKSASTLTTNFVHVMEPHVGMAQVVSVDRFQPTPSTDEAGFERVGLRVTLADGRIDTIIHSLTPDTIQAGDLELSGRAAVVMQREGVTEGAFLLSGTKLRIGDEGTIVGPGTWNGTVDNIAKEDPDDIRLYVSPPPPRGKWVDKYIRIKRSDAHDPFYRIKRIENGEQTAVIHLGRVNLVRGHRNLADYSQGLRYDVKVGDPFEVQNGIFIAGANNDDPHEDPDDPGSGGEEDSDASNPHRRGTPDPDSRRLTLPTLPGCSSSPAENAWHALFGLGALAMVQRRRQRSRKED